MLCKSVCAGGLLLGMAALATSAQAAGAGVKQPSPAALDHLFEDEVYLRMDLDIGAAARYVLVTRIGNTIVLSGEVENADHSRVIEDLVLNAAGAKRKTPSSNTIVPENNRECSGRPAGGGNGKHQQIAPASGECSSLRGKHPRGKFYNHLRVGSSDPALDFALANQLLAEATVELVDAGFDQVMDRSVMRMVVQNGTLYIIGTLDKMGLTRIKTVLQSFPGVREGVYYPE